MGSALVWEILQHLTSLKLLHIVRFSTLCMLPEGIGQLSELQSLHISEYSALEFLPQSIKHLTALQKLFVFGCRGLTKHYEEGVEDDWNLISHIPIVTIVDMELLAQRLTACVLLFFVLPGLEHRWSRNTMKRQVLRRQRRRVQEARETTTPLPVGIVTSSLNLGSLFFLLW